MWNSTEWWDLYDTEPKIPMINPRPRDEVCAYARAWRRHLENPRKYPPYIHIVCNCYWCQRERPTL